MTAFFSFVIWPGSVPCGERGTQRGPHPFATFVRYQSGLECVMGKLNPEISVLSSGGFLACSRDTSGVGRHCLEHHLIGHLCRAGRPPQLSSWASLSRGQLCRLEGLLGTAASAMATTKGTCFQNTGSMGTLRFNGEASRHLPASSCCRAFSSG